LSKNANKKWVNCEERFLRNWQKFGNLDPRMRNGGYSLTTCWMKRIDLCYRFWEPSYIKIDPCCMQSLLHSAACQSPLSVHQPTDHWNDLYDSWQMCGLALPQVQCTRWISSLLSTVSNATIRSRRHKADTFPWSLACWRSLQRFNSTIFVLCCYLYADWWIGIMLWTVRNSCICVCATLFSSFDKNGKLDTGL